MVRKLIDIIRDKIPILTILVQIIIVHNCFHICDNKQDIQATAILIYYPILLVACAIWETAYAVRIYIKTQPDKPKALWFFMSGVSGMISTLIFFTFTYYVDDGRPLSCIIVYNKLIAGIIFYVMIGITLLFSLIEWFVFYRKPNYLIENSGVYDLPYDMIKANSTIRGINDEFYENKTQN